VEGSRRAMGWVGLLASENPVEIGLDDGEKEGLVGVPHQAATETRRTRPDPFANRQRACRRRDARLRGDVSVFIAQQTDGFEERPPAK
jgi:hypothetical protein